MRDRAKGLNERLREAAVLLSLAASEGRALEPALLGIPGAEGVIRLSSRQGACFMVRLSGSQSIFAKLLSDPAGAQREAEFSKLLSEAGISCPKVAAISGRAIARAYIEGRPASEELDAMKEWGDAQSAEKLCCRIGALLASIHSVSQDGSHVTLEDANLRNFIVSTGNDLSVIDLADAAFGDQMEDLGGLLVHILTHRPAFSELSWQMAQAALAGYLRQSKKGHGMGAVADGLRRAFRKASARRADESLVSHEGEAVDRLASNL